MSIFTLFAYYHRSSSYHHRMKYRGQLFKAGLPRRHTYVTLVTMMSNLLGNDQIGQTSQSSFWNRFWQLYKWLGRQAFPQHTQRTEAARLQSETQSKTFFFMATYLLYSGRFTTGVPRGAHPCRYLSTGVQGWGVGPHPQLMISKNYIIIMILFRIINVNILSFPVCVKIPELKLLRYNQEHLHDSIILTSTLSEVLQLLVHIVPLFHGLK